MTGIDQWREANDLWDKATDALLARNYERFDALMHEIKAITRTWANAVPAPRWSAEPEPVSRLRPHGRPSLSQGDSQ